MCAPGHAADGPLACPADLKLTDDEIATRLMERNAERTRNLHGFEGTRQYNVKYTGPPYSQNAEMVVRVSSNASGVKTFTVVSESGSRLILHHIIRRLLASERESFSDEASRDAIAVTTHNYSFKLLGCETPPKERSQYVMQVEPLRPDKYLYHGTIWIDSQDFAATRIEAEPAQNPSFWIQRTQIHHEYEKIGQFYFPKFNQTTSTLRLGGTAVLTIRYFDYKLLWLEKAH